MMGILAFVTVLSLVPAASSQTTETQSIVYTAGASVTLEDGQLNVTGSAYPVTSSHRIAESGSATEESNLAAATRSSFTAVRQSNNYALASMSAGFGPDISFNILDASETNTELGVVGMQVTGDGSANADLVFKTWNGQAEDPNFAAQDAMGSYNRLVIKSSGDVMVPNGRLDVMRSAYPVTVSERVAESATNSEEMDLMKVTRSTFTASRKSNNYALADMSAGFGPDMSFQVVDSANVSTEVGVMGMMMTGDGSANADLVFKTWNGQAEDPNFAAQDAMGAYNRLVIKSSGDVMVPNGRLDVMRSAYPVTVSERVAESATNSEEMDLMKVTRSAFTASRKSNNYALADMSAGFGPDMSFQVVDSANVATELGVMGMMMIGDGSANADFVFKTWNGQAEDPNFAAQDAMGSHNRLVIKSSGDVMVPDGRLDVMRSAYPVTVSERVAESATNSEEMDLMKVTRSAFTASRKSHNYALSEMSAGFGPDMSFQVVDSANVSTEVGVMGMMMTGDGSANADFVFKTWNGQAEDPNFAAQDAMGSHNRLVIKSSGDVMVPDGRLDVMRSAYPVTVSERVAESATNSEEMDLMKVTRSAFTASRKSNNYALSEMSAGFGPDMSFQVVDSANVATELGVMGMMMTGDGSANADFVFKTWNGQAEDPNFAAQDAMGANNRLVIKSSGDVMVPDGRLDVMRSAYPVTVSERVAESAINSEESDLMKVTRSAFTASRKSTKYTLAEMKAGFGPDMSFQVVDSAGTATELGVVGMKLSADGSTNADLVFKVWNGQADDANFAAMDAAGAFDKLVINSNGDVSVSGDLIVQGSPVGNNLVSNANKISDLEDDRDLVVTLLIVFSIILFVLCLILFCCVGYLFSVLRKQSAA